MNSFLNGASGLRTGLVALLLGVALMSGQAAEAQLTPEQQRQLDALPADERQPLMQQYQQANQPESNAGGASQGGSPEGGAGQAQSMPTPPGVLDELLRQEYEEWKEASSLGTDELMPFGYDLFAGEPSSFAPAQDVPVPEGYRIGPGDQVDILLTGRRNLDISVTVDRSGMIELPEVGPLSVHGKTLEQLREYLDGVISDRFIGVQSYVSLGELRTIDIFVTGESRNPGVYAVNAFSSLSHALSVSGGISMGGTLRDIRLLRDGREVTSLDLYNLLLDGELESDAQLEAGDVVFIPPVGDRVTLSGAVARPAIYEVEPGATLEALTALAGGLRPGADPDRIQISRLQPESNRTLIDVSLGGGESFTLAPGDEVQVGRIRDWLNGVIEIKGASPIAGRYRWEEGMRVSDFISSRNQHLAEDVDLSYGVIVSRTGDDYDVSFQVFTPRQVISRPGSSADPVLQERDTVLLFSGSEDREALLQPVIDGLSEDLLPGQLPPVVSLSGAVQYPGTYPFKPGDTVADAIGYAGGLTNASYQLGAELIRQELTSERAESELVEFKLADNQQRDLALAPRDRIHIKQLSDFNVTNTVTLEGEVKFPGSYTILRGETLAEVIERAGGLTEYAFPKAAVFSREALREREQQRLDEAQRRLRRSLALSRADAPGEESTVPGDGQAAAQILEEIGSAQAVGRLVIDLPAILDGEASQDVLLRDGDVLSVPEKSQAVTIMGEVQFATSHRYDASLSIDDYINRSGGLTQQADSGRIYVIQADGAVTVPKRSRWFSGGDPVAPGDTIVVPLSLTRLSGLELAKDVTQIIYELSLGAAAVKSLSN
ncbi:hypothetical protein BA899_09665 [Spiribacter sp. SSL99]|nr:hypothetical protein BA899_09665 [Spiribacter sp. SSL99]